MKGTVLYLGKFIFIVFIFLLLLSYAMFQGGFVSWFLFYGFLPIFIYLVGILLYPIKRMHVSRELSHHVVRAGDSIQVTITMKRSFPFPLYYCICEEVFPDSLNKVDNRTDNYQQMKDPSQLHTVRKIKKLVFAGFKRKFKLSYQIAEIPRGEHQLFAIRFRTGDLFGFIKKEHVFNTFDNLIAYPNEHEIHITERINSFEQGAVTAQNSTLKNTNIASGIREYMPGDKFSWIDWKQTARKNTVMTKEFEQEKSTDTMLIIDGCHHENMNVLAFEAAIEICLSLVETIRKQSSQVGFLSIGEKNMFFPLHHDPMKQALIRQHLTKIQPGGNQAFSVKLKEEVKRFSPGVIVMVITTNVDEAFKQTVQKMKQRTKRIIVCFIESSNLITEKQRQLIQQLEFEGIIINVMTEKQLIQNKIEVRVV
ncbi:DUF58 domain-containing protein [Virgibacillus necropolis]|uniref:DUF58 domain-containing protein n=1 Tax=Virgibacillus necropolis TaxID=163877 RepID=A0A221MHD5_9BACI|nr:DUF58 domain-containing protein [Virgibacillus necropolis]ASN07022.1 DUF58 domain-containing protein [Virgibacillus necropolis]